MQKIKKGALLRLIDKQENCEHIEIAESDFVLGDHDLLFEFDCGCKSSDCSGRSLLFSDGFGGAFWLHDHDMIRDKD